MDKIPSSTMAAAEKAATALLKWKSSKSKENKPQLIESDEFVYLVLTLKKIPPKDRTNPYKIPLPHPLYSPPDSELCLFIDDRKGRLRSKSAKEKISEDDIGVSKVIKLSKLKSDYKAFEAKRKLCDSYNLFLADKRIIPLLPKIIGRHFYKKKKIPVPVELGQKNWKEQINRACSSAFLHLKTGTCCVIRVAKCSMEKSGIVENIVAALNGLAEIVPKKWSNVRSLHLKLNESLALPIYQSVPELKLKIDAMVRSSNISTVGEEGKEIVEQGKVGNESEKKQQQKGLKKKGRIHEVRYMDTGDADLVGGEDIGSEDGGGEFLVESADEANAKDDTEIKGTKRKKVDDKEEPLKKKAGKVKKVGLTKKKTAVANVTDVKIKASKKKSKKL